MKVQDVTTCNVALLTGGWSDEREISRASGEACAKALREAGFSVVDVLDVAEEGFVQRLACGKYDVAFVAMHGRYGEDGCIQGLLEVLHLPYTFSGVLASAMGTEKDVAKVMYRQAGIPTPENVVIKPGTVLSSAEQDELVERLGLPLCVKPACNGSSYGITRVTDVSQLPAALELASSQGDNALVEQCITGMEITVPVIGNDDPQALPIVEIGTGA